MSYTTKDYEHELSTNATWRKFNNPANLQRITSFLADAQWIPSQTTVERAITHLNLQRADDRTQKDDARDIRAVAQRNYDLAAKQAEQMPLTKQELDEFASLSQAELQRQYWGEDGKASDFFSIRYRKASREFGYRIPDKPVPVEVEDEGAVKLSASEYHSMSAQEVLRRMRNPAFKLAVMKLVKARSIALWLGFVLLGQRLFS
jgi:hypothetical protein